ncbi:hypothetical protein KUCAC02_026356, partial [Chaenocephalus aceratus]
WMGSSAGHKAPQMKKEERKQRGIGITSFSASPSTASVLVPVLYERILSQLFGTCTQPNPDSSNQSPVITKSPAMFMTHPQKSAFKIRLWSDYSLGALRDRILSISIFHLEKR